MARIGLNFHVGKIDWDAGGHAHRLSVCLSIGLSVDLIELN